MSSTPITLPPGAMSPSLFNMDNNRRIPFLEDRIPSERLDLVWDNWRSQPQGRTSLNQVHGPNIISPLYESAPPSATSPPTPKSGKRWGIFGSKKPTTDIPIITVTAPINNDSKEPQLKRKKSKVLKKKNIIQTKSTPNLKSKVLGLNDLGKVNAYYAPALDTSSPLPVSPHPAPVCALTDDNFVSDSSGSALYFTVDPRWDVSQGDADVYLLPLPRTPVHRELRREAVVVAPSRQRSKAHVCTARPVLEADTSFLSLD